MTETVFVIMPWGHVTVISQYAEDRVKVSEVKDAENIESLNDPLT